MILNNLTVDDIAVIQCNASNSFGYDFVNAYINVLREPPFIYEGPPSNLRQTEGLPVLLPCRSYSAPKALVSWKKDGRPINGGRYQVKDNGDLIIEVRSIYNLDLIFPSSLVQLRIRAYTNVPQRTPLVSLRR